MSGFHYYDNEITGGWALDRLVEQLDVVHTLT